MNLMLSSLDDKNVADVPRLKELQERQLNQALTFYQSILREGGPLEPTVQKDVAVAFLEAGSIQRKLGFRPQAKENFQRAAGLLEDLVARYPDRAEYRSELAFGYHGLGILTDSTDQKEEWLQKALALREQLCHEEPDNPKWQDHLAQSYHTLGAIRHGRPNAGLLTDLYGKALGINTRLHERFPNEPRYVSAAAEGCFSLGLCYEGAKQPERAESYYRQGENLLKPLVKNYPHETDYAASLAALYLNWARIPLNVRSQPEEAVRLCTQAITLAEEILRMEPRHGIARDACASAYGNRSIAYLALHREAEMDKDLDRAIELSEGQKRRQLRAIRGWNLIQFGKNSQAAAIARAIADDDTVEAYYLYEAAQIAAVAGRNTQHNPAFPAVGGSMTGLLGSPLGQGPMLGASALFPGRRIDERLSSEQRQSQVESCIGLVLTIMRRMSKAGYFRDESDFVRGFRGKEDAFQWLQSRDDFQRVLRETEKKK